MLRNMLKIFAVLILVYLVLVHWGGFSHDIAAITQGAPPIIKAFQGR